MAVVLTVTVWAWAPLSALFDVVRGKWRCPTVRLLAFGWAWSWLETLGVSAAALLWATGQGDNVDAHYRLQRWWAARVVGALRYTIGLGIEVYGAQDLGEGPFVALCRHASLGDALVSAWVFGTHAQLRPRYVLKKELSLDPCLDVVGRRIPNYFVDRTSANMAAELQGIEQMADRLGARDVAVIFPEGTRTSDSKRQREIARLEGRSPERAQRLSQLRHLLPPKPAGASTLLNAVPKAHVLTVWHIGFDGLDTFKGILRHIGSKKAHAKVVIRTHLRHTVDTGENFVAWLDEQWLEMDAAVAKEWKGTTWAR